MEQTQTEGVVGACFFQHAVCRVKICFMVTGQSPEKRRMLE